MTLQKLNGAKSITQKGSLTDTQVRFLDWTRKRLPYEFKVDESNEDAFQSLWAYFMADAVPLPEGFSRGKGFFLFGNPGTGKTDLLRVFQWATVKRPSVKFRKTEVWRICQNFAAEGEKAFSPDSIKPGNWFFDELGLLERETVAHYGNRSNVAERLIHERYNAWKTDGDITHFTTNLSLQQIQEAYDERTVSRLREMCNFIPMTGADRRKTAKIQRLEVEPSEDPLATRSATITEIAADIRELHQELSEKGKLPYLNHVQVKCYYDFLDKRGLISLSVEERRDMYLDEKSKYIDSIGENPMLQSISEIKSFRQLVENRDKPMPTKGNSLDFAVLLTCKGIALKAELGREGFLSDFNSVINSQLKSHKK